MKQKGIRLLTSVAASTYYLGFNLIDPVVGGYIVMDTVTDIKLSKYFLVTGDALRRSRLPRRPGIDWDAKAKRLP